MEAARRPKIVHKKRRTPGEMLTALKLDALNPLSQEAAEHFEQLLKANQGIGREHMAMKRAFWAVLDTVGPTAVSDYKMRHSPDKPEFRVVGNPHNKDLVFSAAKNGANGDGNEPV